MYHPPTQQVSRTTRGWLANEGAAAITSTNSRLNYGSVYGSLLYCKLFLKKISCESGGKQKAAIIREQLQIFDKKDFAQI